MRILTKLLDGVCLVWASNSRQAAFFRIQFWRGVGALLSKSTTLLHVDCMEKAPSQWEQILHWRQFHLGQDLVNLFFHLLEVLGPFWQSLRFALALQVRQQKDLLDASVDFVSAQRDLCI